MLADSPPVVELLSAKAPPMRWMVFSTMARPRPAPLAAVRAASSSVGLPRSAYRLSLWLCRNRLSNKFDAALSDHGAEDNYQAANCFVPVQRLVKN